MDWFRHVSGVAADKLETAREIRGSPRMVLPDMFAEGWCFRTMRRGQLAGSAMVRRGVARAAVSAKD